MCFEQKIGSRYMIMNSCICNYVFFFITEAIVLRFGGGNSCTITAVHRQVSDFLKHQKSNVESSVRVRVSFPTSSDQSTTQGSQDTRTEK